MTTPMNDWLFKLAQAGLFKSCVVCPASLICVSSRVLGVTRCINCAFAGVTIDNTGFNMEIHKISRGVAEACPLCKLSWHCSGSCSNTRDGAYVNWAYKES